MKKIIAAFSNKTNDLRVRLMIFFLLHKNFDKTSLTNSLQALVSHHPHHKKKNDDAIDEEEELELVENRQYNKEYEDDDEEMKGHSLLLNYNKATSMMVSDTPHDMRVVQDVPRIYTPNQSGEQQRNVDLTHALFKESEAEMEKEEETEEAVEGGEQRMVEEEEDMGDEDIDQAADMFIQRFKKQMLLQKQRSLERQQYNNGCYLLSNA